MARYSIKELFYTLQGEGANAGRPAVFCRFSGCNLWTGLETARSSALCKFCDTDFVGTDGPGGGKFPTAESLADAAVATVEAHGPSKNTVGTHGPSKNDIIQQRILIVCTGGEPLLQLDQALVEAFHEVGFEVAVETNGTLEPPPGIDWICVSPKAEAELVLTHGDELKLVYPQEGASPEAYAQMDFQHFFLQPMDGPALEANTAAAVEYCLAHPQWRLSLQTHKLIGIP